MSTTSTSVGPRAVHRPWIRTTRCAVGVEAGSTSMRVAQRRLCGEEQVWSLSSIQLAAEDPAHAGKAGLGLRQIGKKWRSPGGAAICAISAPAVDIFPLNLQPRDSETLDAQVVAHARKLLSTPLEKVVLDYSPLPEWVRRPNEETVPVLVFCASREMVDTVLQGTERLGLRIDRLITPACALAQQLARTEPESRHLTIATSEDATSVSVVQNGYVLLERIIPWSMQRLVERLRTELDLEERHSRSLLVRWDSSKAPPEWAGWAGEKDLPFEGAVREVLAPALQELTNEAVGCLGYCASFLKHAPTSAVVLVGPLANHALLRDSLQAELGLQVRGPEQGLPLSGLDRESEGPAFATAACCALWSEGGLP